MAVNNYKTKTTMTEVNNSLSQDVWTVALDVGYSAVKVLAPNKVFSFPTFARPAANPKLEIISPDITIMRYRDANNIVYDVGGRAIDIADDFSVLDNEDVMYRRNWYNNETYRICLECALAIAIMSNPIRQYKGEPIRVITGLPCQFIDDIPILVSLISGEHSFDFIPPNEKEWTHIQFTVESTTVIEQPMGAYWSTLFREAYQRANDFSEIAGNNTLILDGGFGTFDMYGIIGKSPQLVSTYTDFSMKEVFKRTTNEIKERSDKLVPIPLLYKYLDDGKIRYVNIIKNSAGIIDPADPECLDPQSIVFSEILLNHSNDVAKKALLAIRADTNNFSAYKSVILSGGTIAAWFGLFKPYIEKFGVRVYSASRYCRNIGECFAIARGYYMRLALQIQKESGDLK